MISKMAVHPHVSCRKPAWLRFHGPDIPRSPFSGRVHLYGIGSAFERGPLVVFSWKCHPRQASAGAMSLQYCRDTGQNRVSRFFRKITIDMSRSICKKQVPPARLGTVFQSFIFETLHVLFFLDCQFIEGPPNRVADSIRKHTQSNSVKAAQVDYVLSEFV